MEKHREKDYLNALYAHALTVGEPSGAARIRTGAAIVADDRFFLAVAAQYCCASEPSSRGSPGVSVVDQTGRVGVFAGRTETASFD
jgi:hypothetical protein